MMKRRWKVLSRGALALALGLAVQGCCTPDKTAVKHAAKHISDTAEAGKAAYNLCKNPPAGQDPTQFCGKVTEAFDDIKQTSDALHKSAE